MDGTKMTEDTKKQDEAIEAAMQSDIAEDDSFTDKETSSDSSDQLGAVSAFDDGALCKKFASELSRSLEYFQLQSGQNKPKKFLLDPAFKEKAELQDCLSQRLSMPVEILDITKLVELKIKIDPEKQILCLSVIGAAMGIDKLPLDSENHKAIDKPAMEQEDEATR